VSLRATLWAYDRAPVERPTELLVLIALADEANDEGRNAFPSVARIAHRARCKPRAAKYALRALEEAGVIVRGDQSIAARHIARADRRPTVYDLCLDKVDEARLTDEKRGAPDAPGEERGAREGTNGVHGGAPDPSIDPTTNPTKDPAPSADADAESDLATIIAQSWWEHYQAHFGPVVRNGRNNPFIALRDNLVRSALDVGFTENEIKRALLGPHGQTPDPVPPKPLFQRRLSEVRNGTLGNGAGPEISNRHHVSVDSPDRARRIAELNGERPT
jgi:hypothetical protein